LHYIVNIILKFSISSYIDDISRSRVHSPILTTFFSLSSVMQTFEALLVFHFRKHFTLSRVEKVGRDAHITWCNV